MLSIALPSSVGIATTSAEPVSLASARPQSIVPSDVESFGSVMARGEGAKTPQASSGPSSVSDSNQFGMKPVRTSTPKQNEGSNPAQVPALLVPLAIPLHPQNSIDLVDLQQPLKPTAADSNGSPKGSPTILTPNVAGVSATGIAALLRGAEGSAWSSIDLEAGTAAGSAAGPASPETAQPDQTATSEKTSPADGDVDSGGGQVQKSAQASTTADFEEIMNELPSAVTNGLQEIGGSAGQSVLDASTASSHSATDPVSDSKNFADNAGLATATLPSNTSVIADAANAIATPAAESLGQMFAAPFNSAGDASENALMRSMESIRGTSSVRTMPARDASPAQSAVSSNAANATVSPKLQIPATPAGNPGSDGAANHSDNSSDSGGNAQKNSNSDSAAEVKAAGLASTSGDQSLHAPADAPAQSAGAAAGTTLVANAVASAATNGPPGSSGDNTAAGAIVDRPMPAPVGQPQSLNDVVKASDLYQRVGGAEMHISMDTDLLGSIDVRAVVHQSTLTATIGVSRADVQTLLANELPALQHSLSEQSLNVHEISVMSGSIGARTDLNGNSQQQHQTAASSRNLQTVFAGEPFEDFGPQQISSEALLWGGAEGRISIHV